MIKELIRDFNYIKNPILHIPVTFTKRALFGKTPYWRQYFWNKWGFLERDAINALRNKKVLWINAISGGEITQAVSFCKNLRKKFSNYRTLLSTDSQDAFYYAKSIHMSDYIIDAPWDIKSIVHRCLKDVHPVAIIYIENAYYPKLLMEAKNLGIKNILISARMNENVLKGHILFKRAEKMKFFNYIDVIAAKTEKDKNNFIALGYNPKNICVLGDLRYDLEYIRLDNEEKENLRKELGFLKRDKIFLAGSVHKIEFELVLNAYSKARAKISGLKMIMAPRWFYEIAELKSLLKSRDLNFKSRSDYSNRKDFDVLILDTFGELARTYGISDVVYIANSIIPINERGAGHNVIEPLAHGKPIVFGKYMNFWRDITKEIKNICPQCEVNSIEELETRICELLTNANLIKELKTLGRRVSLERSGAVGRYIKFIEEIA